MPYDGEEPPVAEPDGELDELARVVIGAAIEVHRRLGPGLDEALYEGALCVELRRRDVPFARQVVFPVLYRDEVSGEKKMDLIVAGRLVVELKAVEILTTLHKAQLRTYLKITHNKLGLLINFNTPVLKDGIKRVINPAG
jgi:GxxExxY protein